MIRTALYRCMIALGCLLAAGVPARAPAREFDRQEWLDDFSQVREAFATKYANLEWAQHDSAHRLSDLLDETQARINRANADADARAAFDRLTRRLGDGHVHFDWPSVVKAGAQPTGPTSACRSFDPSRAASPLMTHASGYVSLQTPQSGIFPAGILLVANQKVGVIEIGLIGAGARPELCSEALALLRLRLGDTCDDTCETRIERIANARYTEAFAAQIVAIKAAGATALLIDIAGNGGGNEWADAAARMLTSKRLVSERMAFVRGKQWSTNLLTLEATLRNDAVIATGADKAMLQDYADQAHEKAMTAATSCDSRALLLGLKPNCAWLGRGFFVTGPLASADPEKLKGRPWAQDIFTPMMFPYEEGVWRGPLMVLIDGDTASSAEAFAAVLQDNHAALIIGTASQGAGCGHTDGSEPVTLKYSGAMLALPDCVYLRADGTNEVRGVVPDLLIGFRRFDSANHRSDDVISSLPEAMQRASVLKAMSH